MDNKEEVEDVEEEDVEAEQSRRSMTFSSALRKHLGKCLGNVKFQTRRTCQEISWSGDRPLKGEVGMPVSESVPKEMLSGEVLIWPPCESPRERLCPEKLRQRQWKARESLSSARAWAFLRTLRE